MKPEPCADCGAEYGHTPLCGLYKSRRIQGVNDQASRAELQYWAIEAWDYSRGAWIFYDHLGKAPQTFAEASDELSGLRDPDLARLRGYPLPDRLRLRPTRKKPE